MEKTISPANGVRGVVRLPGDKSVSHRYGMLASIAEGVSEITNYSSGADCAATLECMRSMGVKIERDGDRVTIHGVGLDGLREPGARLDVGNSGSTIRMLSGILAGQRFVSEIAGDESIARRPMKRIITPLTEMGARIEARDGEFAPLRITGSKLRAIDYAPPVASAQVKTAVLFGGIYADGTTKVRETIKTRDHSEIALAKLGAELRVDGLEVTLQGRPRLMARNVRVPSDISSAAFFLAAALLHEGSELRIEGVGLNPTRAELLNVLSGMGAAIEIEPDPEDGGELTGSLTVRGGAKLAGGVIEGATTAGVIDEVPMLAVLGAVSRDGLVIRDAKELRVKETDRIATVADNLRRMGAEVEDFEDGMRIAGGARLRAAELDSFGDHRIAMAFAVAALAADGPCVMRGAEAASVSFPEFYDTLAGVA